ncbi:MAG: alginate lyase family protein [Magnetococcales bacterium]|nr:alginate lyase family protein [Magnetococcales bacterium]
MKPTLMTWFHTIRYLRFKQIYSRLWFKLYYPAPDFTPAPCRRQPVERWQLTCKRTISLLRPWVFRFLNEERELINPQSWQDVHTEKLWLYNLHYFDDLNAMGAEKRTALHREFLMRWVNENPPGAGVGWEPYPTSLRIVNWIKWVLFGNDLDSLFLNSLATQTRWLFRRIEFHLLGNHLFSNAKALVFSGLFFTGPEADNWYSVGMALLEQELSEQILPDGGQFERTPMYHALALEDMLDLLNLLYTFNIVPPLTWKDYIVRMYKWLMAMVHPDGEISFFNDAAMGVAPSLLELKKYGQRLRAIPDNVSLSSKILHLKESGYLRANLGPMLAILDVAPVGPDYLPGHAHADTLSFEISLYEQRLLVNSGTSFYGIGEERLRQRGTAAHNTVIINGQDSSEMWGNFRVARRAQPFDLFIEHSRPSICVRCNHNGYYRLTGRPIHQRCWEISEHQMKITDWIHGPYTQAEARYHIHPDVSISQDDLQKSRLRLTLPSQHHVQLIIEGNWRIEESTWHPSFGISLPNTCLNVSFTDKHVCVTIIWQCL